MRKTHTFSLVLVLILFGTASTKAQKSVSDSSIFMTMAHFSYAMQFPGGDLADRFGMNSSVGGGMLFKTASNWMFGFDANYIFGKNIENKDELLSNIKTSYDFIIDNSGLPAEINFHERGFSVFGRFGKLFPVLSPNPNSGVFVMAGLGFLQHKIHIESLDNMTAAVAGDYRKGYDKLCSGLAVNQMVGYLYMGNSRVVNFYAGFEFTQAWTKSRREYDFTEMKKDVENRFDLLNGFKVGWVISIYKREAREYYFD